MIKEQLYKFNDGEFVVAKYYHKTVGANIEGPFTRLWPLRSVGYLTKDQDFVTLHSIRPSSLEKIPEEKRPQDWGANLKIQLEDLVDLTKLVKV